MPQMSPMWWTSLMMIFITIFVMNMSFTYFNYNKMINKKKTQIMTNYKWMW
uniref:ATP synthase F0 subunit 8 n=1 Tax=Zyginella minuta TaxID=2769890 RepID=A0A7H0DHZ0_9HEMI|nr:ATP synthase F0 subunit 8 [Zyginella minuta]QNP08950.1 ATP synthase F0 subunit 8 [Zyginella minuta]